MSRGGSEVLDRRSLTCIGILVQIPSAIGNIDMRANRSKIVLFPVFSGPIMTMHGGVQPSKVELKTSRQGSRHSKYLLRSLNEANVASSILSPTNFCGGSVDDFSEILL